MYYDGVNTTARDQSHPYVGLVSRLLWVVFTGGKGAMEMTRDIIHVVFRRTY